MKMGRWGWAVVTFFLGAIAVWGLNGFKSPFSGMMASNNNNNTPQEGDSCTILGSTTKGTIQGGICKA